SPQRTSRRLLRRRLLAMTELLLTLTILLIFAACGKKKETVPEIPLTLIDSWGGTNVDEQTMIGYPSDFIVSSKGEAVVTDVRLNQVLFFDRAGNIIRRVGGPGKGPLEFAIPDDIAQIGDKLVVWDYQNNRLQFLTLEGEFISTSTPEPRIDFNAKTFDSRGRLYYATGGFRADSMVYVYNRNGEFVKTFGELEGDKFTDYDVVNLRQSIERRELPAALTNATLLCTTSDGGIFVVHTALPILKKYTISGQKLFEVEIDHPGFKQQRDDFFAANDTLPDFSFKPLRFWSDIAADATGGVFILQNDRAKMIVSHFDANGKLTEKYFGPNENISKIFFDGSELWAVGRENLVFYRFSLTPPEELTTDK
ncbi:MAG: 6-bladed beta-propeller, partial [bacterium]